MEIKSKVVRMFTQFFEVFRPKAMEYIAEQGLANALNMMYFKQTLENLEENLKLLSAIAFDVETKIKNEEKCGRKKRKREVELWLERVESIEKVVDELGSEAESKGFFMRFLDGGKATQLNGDIVKLFQLRLDFGELVFDSRGTRGETLLTNEMVGKDFNENLERILKLLEDRQVSKIGVYGMGGVGKTTLAKHVYNRLVQEYEGRVVWITVSQEFTIKNLQDKMAHFLGVKLEEYDEEAFRATRLDRFLTQKKITVVILDDMWENIDMKKVGCTFSVECCRLIITTRSSKVCDQIGCRKIYVEILREDEAWNLFNDTLGNETQLGPQVEEIARSMAKLCDGLPLGIITIAGSMKGETTVHTWRNALAELKDCLTGKDETGEVDEVLRVLRYSFDRLNRNYQSESNEFDRLQLCFLYCSLYPEDHEINRDGLVRKLISEGLVIERKSRREGVEQGLSILDKLVNVCLLESCVDYEGEKCVKMHDLVRSMALKICKGKYMVRAGEWSFKEIPYNEEEWTKDLEKASFMECNIRRIREGLSPDCPKLSTLLLLGNYSLKVIPDSFFSKMQGLCTLNLSRTGLRVLPNSVSDLTSLKALLLESCNELEKVPYLGKLKALRELNLSGTAIKEAPQGLEELINLRFLSMNAYGLKMFPRGVLLKLGHLQHLNLPVHIQVEELKGLKQLEKFGGGVKNVSDFNWYVTTSGSHATCCYRIGVNYSRKAFGLHIGMEGDLGGKKNVLVLCESNLKDEKVFGQGIAYLSIVECEGLSKCFVDDLPQRFNNPTSLRELGIWNCGEIECLLRSDGQFSNTLEVIRLYSLDNLKRVIMERAEEIGASIAPTQPAMFFSLRTLDIDNCNKMRKLGFAVTGLPNLECIIIWSCKEMEEIFEEDEGRPTSIVATFPKLKRLELWSLPNLKKVGLHIQEIPNLESTSIRGCGEIQEIFEEDEGRDASILARLQVLCLRDLPKLKRVSKTRIKSNSIREIFIENCPRLMNKLPVDIDGPTPPSTLKRIQVDEAWWKSLESDINLNFPVEFHEFK